MEEVNRTAYWRARRNARKDQGICRDCPEPLAAKNKTYCVQHVLWYRPKNSARQRERRYKIAIATAEVASPVSLSPVPVAL